MGSCTGNAIAGAVQFEREKQKLTPDFVPSRLFIYYNERVIESSVDTDSGAQIRDGIKVVNKQGVPRKRIGRITSRSLPKSRRRKRSQMR